MAITRRQKEVIDFLSGFTQKNGYSPSYEEIASGLGLNSLATVHKHVTNLQNKGPPTTGTQSQPLHRRPSRPLHKEGVGPAAPDGAYRRWKAGRSHRIGRDDLPR